MGLCRLNLAAFSDLLDVIHPHREGSTNAALNGLKSPIQHLVKKPNVHQFSELCAPPKATLASRLSRFEQRRLDIKDTIRISIWWCHPYEAPGAPLDKHPDTEKHSCSSHKHSPVVGIEPTALDSESRVAAHYTTAAVLGMAEQTAPPGQWKA
ncbi:jg17650 [Pararge aegeria aegeria]|uniref:Jg17650 protein n=1 Tax=Pararge aegeria aegeria TaxID=348720 RepID=A0A8S4RI57_9NEOP|nr:jg17650 [Pararge aegeria aegeria]